MAEMRELADKNINTAVVNMSHVLRKIEGNINTMRGKRKMPKGPK